MADHFSVDARGRILRDPDAAGFPTSLAETLVVSYLMTPAEIAEILARAVDDPVRVAMVSRPSLPGVPIPVTGSRAANAGDSGATLVFGGAFTITVPAGMPAGFGFAAIPPDSGNASIAASGTTLNGAGTTVTRTLAANAVFALVQKGANAYIVTGS